VAEFEAAGRRPTVRFRLPRRARPRSSTSSAGRCASSTGCSATRCS
jgi:hypothetical protein